MLFFLTLSFSGLAHFLLFFLYCHAFFVISLTLFSLLFALLLYFPPFFFLFTHRDLHRHLFSFFFVYLPTLSSLIGVLSFFCPLLFLLSFFFLFSLFVLIFCCPLVLLFSSVAHSFSQFLLVSLFAVLSVYCYLFSFDFLSPALRFFNLLFLSLSFMCVTSRPLLMVR